jgi:hypothetical protein
MTGGIMLYVALGAGRELDAAVLLGSVISKLQQLLLQKDDQLQPPAAAYQQVTGTNSP